MFDSFEVKSSIRGTYSVHFVQDILDTLGSSEEKAVFLIDVKVQALYPGIADFLQTKRFVTIDCREEHKTVEYCLTVIRELLAREIRRDDVLIVIGGGIAQDIGAFISTVLYRGIEWKFYPTTLLAQGDSCIGSKSSINFDQYKNLIGTFNPPSQIFIYPGFLSTLSVAEIKSGIGEMLHYFLIDGISIAQEVDEQYEQLLEGPSALTYFTLRSLQIKRRVIEVDEFDRSIRHIFNYGHTFGHAVEAVTKYAVPHGIAVTLGMDMANYISMRLGFLSEEDFDLMHRTLKKNLPDYRVRANDIEPYLSALSRDKKNIGKKLGCILSRGPGKMEKVFVEMDSTFRNIIADYAKHVVDQEK